MSDARATEAWRTRRIAEGGCVCGDCPECRSAGAPLPGAVYTDAEATDEAVLLALRKWRRLHPKAYADVMDRLSEGARDALTLADNRADRLRADGTSRRFVTIAELAEMDTTDE